MRKLTLDYRAYLQMLELLGWVWTLSNGDVAGFNRAVAADASEVTP